MGDHQGAYGTERDKINCPFYIKIGACRHGDRCSKIHHKPLVSQSVLLKNMYQHPAAHMSIVDSESLEYDDEEIQKSVEDFYEDLVPELQKFGDIEEVHVCENLGEHLMGNVYVKFATEDGSTRCVQALNGRYYAGKPIYAEFSPVTSFREARCRQFDQSDCSRGGFCNFMHIRRLRKEFYNKLFPYKRSTNPNITRDRNYPSSSSSVSTSTTTTPASSSPTRKRGNSRERERDVKRTRSSRSPPSVPPRREERRDTERSPPRREEYRREEYRRDTERSPPRREERRGEDYNRREEYRRGEDFNNRREEYNRRDERDTRREEFNRRDERREIERSPRKEEYRREERRDDYNNRREEDRDNGRRREDYRREAEPKKEIKTTSREEDYSPTAAYDQ